MSVSLKRGVSFLALLCATVFALGIAAPCALADEAAGIGESGATAAPSASSALQVTGSTTVVSLASDASGSGEDASLDIAEAAILGDDAAQDASTSLMDSSAAVPIPLSATFGKDAAYSILSMVNSLRAENGLAALSWDSELEAAALQRVAELTLYDSHTRPSGYSCFTAFPSGIGAAGENIANGDSWLATPEFVFSMWSVSEGHRRNMLGERYQSIGIACAYANGKTYYVQCFGGTSGDGVRYTSIGDAASMTIEVPESSVQEVFFDYDASRSMYLCLQDEAHYLPSIIYTASGSYENPSGEYTGFEATANLSADYCEWEVDPEGIVAFGTTYDDPMLPELYGWQVGTTTLSYHYVDSQGNASSVLSNSFKAVVLDQEHSACENIMYRMYNPNSGEHFYTASQAERNSLITAGWNYEGIGWTAPATSETPVYRMYNPNPGPNGSGEHHYTTDKAEKEMLEGAGWRYEGIGWYSDDAKTVQLYREYNPNAFNCNHNYTTSKSEHDYLVGLGWEDEGIAWYGVAK